MFFLNIKNCQEISSKPLHKSVLDDESWVQLSLIHENNSIQRKNGLRAISDTAELDFSVSVTQRSFLQLKIFLQN